MPHIGKPIEEYTKIQEDAYNGKVMILEESRQYDSTTQRFMLWLRYDIIYYALSDRYEYLRESE